MKKYWQIVPRGDGYTYMIHENGEHKLASKNGDASDKNLMFKTKKECNEYIKSNLDPKEYVAEDFMIDEKYYGIKL